MKLFSPAVKAASAFTLGGAAFALANLLLARNLSTQEYGEFALILAITTVSIPLGSISLDAIVLRHRPGPQAQLLKLSILTGLTIGTFVALLGSLAYSIDERFLPLIVLAIAAGSVTRMSSSIYQSEKHYKASLWLLQSQNVTLILAAIFAGLFVSVTTQIVYSAYAGHWLLAAIIGWVSVKQFSGLLVNKSWKIPWAESAPLFGHLLAAQLTAQLDRLMIPKLLNIESLATFGVLAALVIAPFKMFQTGMGYTLIPGLRTATNKKARRDILAHESMTAAFVIFVAILSGFVVAPWVTKIFLQGKYVLEYSLIGAAVFAGSLQVAVVFVSSIVTALGNRGQLALLNRGTWLALAISIAGGWWGARWGLPGVVLGFSSGGLLRIVVAASIATRLWHAPERARKDAT
jgi:O-antigen/teichoic acid export membrane protein